MYKHLTLTDNVFFIDIRNHSIDFFGFTASRKVHTLHDGYGSVFGSYYYHHPERALQETEYAQNGTLGEELLHKKYTEAAVDESTKRSAY